MMLKVTLRNLAAHKLRLVLTAVSVILGVAFVAGTLIFTDTMNRQFDEVFGGIGKNVAVYVRAKPVVEGGEELGGRRAAPTRSSSTPTPPTRPGCGSATGSRW